MNVNRPILALGEMPGMGRFYQLTRRNARFKPESHLTDFGDGDESIWARVSDRTENA